jgi:hypothetical protein
VPARGGAAGCEGVARGGAGAGELGRRAVGANGEGAVAVLDPTQRGACAKVQLPPCSRQPRRHRPACLAPPRPRCRRHRTWLQRRDGVDWRRSHEARRGGKARRAEVAAGVRHSACPAVLRLPGWRGPWPARLGDGYWGARIEGAARRRARRRATEQLAYARLVALNWQVPVCAPPLPWPSATCPRPQAQDPKTRGAACSRAATEDEPLKGGAPEFARQLHPDLAVEHDPVGSRLPPPPWLRREHTHGTSVASLPPTRHSSSRRGGSQPSGVRQQHQHSP